MDVFADKLGRIGAWCGQNKYLGSIKNAFQNYMPATIAGAIGVLWTNVLVNTESGLGALWQPIMVLEVLNPVFSGIQFATISCIAIGIAMLVAQEIGEANGETGAYNAVLGFIAWLVVTPSTIFVWEGVIDGAPGYLSGTILPSQMESMTSITGISGNYTGATGLFTALIVGIVSMEIYGWLRKQDALRIKMPEQVPPGVSRAFEVLIPSFIMLAIVGTIGHVLYLLTGQYMNDLISSYIQEPLSHVIGNNLIPVLFMYLIICLFWLVGIHGNNMVSAIKEPIFRPLLYANTALFQKNATEGYNTFNLTMLQMFGEYGGSGVTISLVFAIFIVGKRADNRAIATLSIVPGLFNINETVIFGIPMVLNPILGIPFVLTPMIGIVIGWLLITIGFCPPVVIEVPWTMPPVIQGFIATGGSLMGAVSQLIAVVVTTIVYIPFVVFYERYQNKQSAEA